jgi:intron-binding protein aquarius
LYAIVDQLPEYSCRVVSLPLWSSLSAERLQQLLQEMPEYRPHAQALAASKQRLEATFLPGLLADLVALLARTRPGMGQSGQAPLSAAEAQLVQYACRFLVLVVDLLAQLPTRRFFRVLLEDSHFYTQCHLSRASTCWLALLVARCSLSC